MKEVGSRCLFIVLYVWLGNALSRSDYQVREPKDRDAGKAQGFGASLSHT